MVQKLSEFLGIDPEQLKEKGIFDAVIGVDSNLFVDPHLLEKTSVPEFVGSRDKIVEHFKKVIKLILVSKTPGDRPWKEARRMLRFKEIKGVSIGYSVHNDDGSAVGEVLADKLLEGAREIISLGVQDPEIFELLGLFESGIGADRISDISLSILENEVIKYTSRISEELGLERKYKFVIDGETYLTPLHPEREKPLFFLPEEILNDLPIALNRDEIINVIEFNENLRRKVNSIVGRTWEEVRSEMNKETLRKIFLSDKEYIVPLVDRYKRSEAASYDFVNDPNGELIWLDIGRYFAKNSPLEITLKQPRTADDIKKILKKVIEKFKAQIENNGLNEHLYAGKKIRPERFSQRLFFSVADSYCEANNIDLSREPNSGTGPVDFKASAGYDSRVLVEIKLSSNTALLRGYEKQLPTYVKSEGAKASFYVVIRVTKSDKNIQKLLEQKRLYDEAGNVGPPIIVIDGLIYPSASKRK